MSLPDVTGAAKDYGDSRADRQAAADQVVLDALQARLVAAEDQVAELTRVLAGLAGPARRDVLGLGAAVAALTVIGEGTTMIVLTAVLDKPSYTAGETMTLTVTENVTGRTLRVTDPATTWTKVSDTGTKATWTAKAVASGAVTVTLTRNADGVTSLSGVSYTVTAPPPVSTLRYGMSAPKADWALVLSQVQAAGGKLKARRLFVADFAGVPAAMAIAKSEWAAGRYPVMSLSADGDAEWTKFADGTYDPALLAMIAQVEAAGVPCFWTVQHEPIGDGSPGAYAAMQAHVAPMFAAAGISYGVIFNGYAWSSMSQGMTDYEIAAWLPDSLLDKLDVVAADTYHGGTTASPGETAGPKIRNLSRWADRHNVDRLGIGEFSGLDGNAIRDAGAALAADPRYTFACVFNSARNNRPGVDWTLKSDRLAAFQSLLST